MRTRIQKGKKWRLSAVLLALPSLAGCGATDGESGAPLCAEGSGACGSTEQIGNAKQALYGSREIGYFWGDADTAANNNTFVNTPTTIDMCWETVPNAVPEFSEAQLVAYRDYHRALIEKTWSRYARLNTKTWEACSAGQPGIHIRLCSGSWTNPDGTTGNCPPGGGVGVNEIGVNGAGIDGQPDAFRFNTSQMDGVFVHEFGHALGFIHDEVRHRTMADAIHPGSDTEFSAELPYPCAGEWFDDEHTITIYQVALLSQPEPTPSDAVTYGGLYWGTNDGSFGFPYEWSSIMAYCHNPVNRPFPYLNHTDVAGVQRIYGRRQRGTLLSTRANCTEMAGTQVLLSDFNCDEFGDVQEFIPVLSDGDAWNLRTTNTDGTTKCIAPTSATNGAAITPQACSTGTDWRFQSMNLVGYGGLCLDLTNGSLTAGNTINAWSCGTGLGLSQVWTRTRQGQIKFGTTNWCAELDANAGGRLRLQVCNASNSRQIFNFSFPNQGQISRWNGSAQECLDIDGPSDAEFHPASGIDAINGPGGGAAVHAFTCNTSLNQRWNLTGALRFGANANLCLHRDTDAPNQPLTLRNCAFTENQVWDYYF